MTGEVLEVARLVRGCFGRHGMRILGMWDASCSSAVNALEFLRAVRTKHLSADLQRR
jgi:hypothetical protein